MEALPLPDLNLPKGDQVVNVHAIDTTTTLVCDAFAFIEPTQPGHEKINMKTMCFLLEHKTSEASEYVLFDCGSRKDFWNGSPTASRMIGGHVPSLIVEKGVDEILVEGGLDLSQLKALIWSHWHWDHIGDASKFPATVDIVVGPGFKENYTPGYPEDPRGVVLAKDMEGHEIFEPSFEQDVAGFGAYDFFGDGSFYLLDVPGHAIGHICGLARTTTDTFVLLGGDCCHFTGVFRPSPYAPLPIHIPTGVLDDFYPAPCPCSLFEASHAVVSREHDRTGLDQLERATATRMTPFYNISRAKGSAYTFAELAQQSVDRLQPLDAHPHVLICLAHDGKLMELLPLFNQDPANSINGWQSWGIKDKSRWDFLNELPKGQAEGRKPTFGGIYRNHTRLQWDGDAGFIDIGK
ncbi:unnamed protein product [Clonostachys byssicola]|uniref:Metallo-beta-lactamase domain-containing protein n=1 Tax=Clonostachys byssicola TaxID=160290 RepID=A0A9N9XYF7_9HYPO|nr:unnamed protein product [Clonostachys byssicola]